MSFQVAPLSRAQAASWGIMRPARSMRARLARSAAQHPLGPAAGQHQPASELGAEISRGGKRPPGQERGFQVIVVPLDDPRVCWLLRRQHHHPGAGRPRNSANCADRTAGRRRRNFPAPPSLSHTSCRGTPPGWPSSRLVPSNRPRLPGRDHQPQHRPRVPRGHHQHRRDLRPRGDLPVPQRQLHRFHQRQRPPPPTSAKKHRPNVERVISPVASRGGRPLKSPLPGHRQKQRLAQEPHRRPQPAHPHQRRPGPQ